MRVLVCRPLAGAERTARRLRALGHEPVLAPVLTIRPLDTPLPDISPDMRPDAIVLTSGEAVPALVRLRGLRDTRIFAVGERTRDRASAAGHAAVQVGDGTARDLARAIADAVPAGATVLLAAGRDRKAEPECSLRAAGMRVAVWETYEAIAAEELPGEAATALRDGRLDAALHFSRRSAASLSGLVAAADLSRRFASLSHHCISADAAGGLAGVPPDRVRVAERPDEEALLVTLA